MNLVQTRLIGELQASTERFSVLQHATNDIVWDWDLATGSVTWNERVSELLGYPPQDVRQDSAWWPSLVHPDDRERVTESFRRAVHGGNLVWSDEYRLRRADGTYARVLDRGAILRNSAGAPVRILGTVLDMSEREEMRARLSLADRMASVGTLAAGRGARDQQPPGLRHRQPGLRAPGGGGGGDGPGASRGGGAARALREAREGAERVRLIVRDLKTFSRPDDARLERGGSARGASTRR